jgi:hypothetical protein
MTSSYATLIYCTESHSYKSIAKKIPIKINVEELVHLDIATL